jgi:hypothetical protein
MTSAQQHPELKSCTTRREGGCASITQPFKQTTTQGLSWPFISPADQS